MRDENEWIGRHALDERRRFDWLWAALGVAVCFGVFIVLAALAALP